MIAVVAVALVYDPTAAPLAQSFEDGLSKLVALLLRLLLPLTVAVLLIYLGFIPFNWREPFENREVLMIFNAMLFAVIALLMGVTPVHEADLGERAQTWLRRGVIALAALALLVSLYVLAAILYRTVNGHLTPNRLLFIGWNVINIAILALLLILQGRAGRARWLPAMHRAFAIGTVLYLIWAVVGPGGAALAVSRRSGPGGQSTAEDPTDRFRPTRADPAEMPDQPAHLPAGSRSETLGEGHPDLRGARATAGVM